MSRNNEPYDLDGSLVLRRTRLAALVRLNDLREVWIPLSVIIDGDDVLIGGTDISIRSWWAEQEDI
jgi:hypothetical protein